MRTRVRTDELQAILARRGISQAQFARMLSISRPSVNRLIHGVHEPRPEVRERLMAVLGLGFDDLFEITRKLARGRR